MSHADAGAPTDSACGRADTSARLPSCPYREYARSVYGSTCVGRGRHHRGSSSVLIGGRPAARMGDQTAHGGQIVMGCPTVIIGG
ncbi:MAG: PAAR domain-containing protein [Bilophila wadsworthia]